MGKTEIYRKNMEAARSFFPGLEQKIAGAEVGGDFVLEEAVSGAPTARLGGRYLHSARDPEREAARLVAASGGTAGGEGRAFLLLGFGLGYVAEAAAALRPRPLVIAVEKRTDVLRAAFEARDLTGVLGSGLVFVLGGDPAAVTEALRIAPKELSLIRNPALTAADAGFYREVERYVENRRTKDAVNEATLRRFGKRWIRNQAANLWALRDLPGIERLAGRFDFPVLLLAAGPTLDELGWRIAPLADRCVVVAVDTALSFLRREGVRPDFTVSVDPQFWNARHLDRALPPESVLVAEGAVYPSVLRDRAGSCGTPGGAAFLCASLYPLSAFIERRVDVKGRLGAGGSVASAAWDFAVSLAPEGSARPVFVAGLDLAFPRLATHYRGALFEKRALSSATRFIPAETASFRALLDGYPFMAKAADGSPVLTDKRLCLYASWFESRLKARAGTHKRGNFRFSGKGLAINGFETARVEDVLALPPCREAISERLEEVLEEVFQQWNDNVERGARAARYEAARAALVAGLEAALKAPGQGASDPINAGTPPSGEIVSIAGFLRFPSRDAAGKKADGRLPEAAYGELADCAAFTLSALRGAEAGPDACRG
jgi:hypothetical protein